VVNLKQGTFLFASGIFENKVDPNVFILLLKFLACKKIIEE